MRNACLLSFAITLLAYTNECCAQLWKQYADTAKSFYDKREFDKAINYFTKAKEQLPKDSSGTISLASICNSLSNCYFNLRRFTAAEPYSLETKQIRGNVLGKAHPEYASACYNLANLYTAMEQFEKAEALYLEARAIWEKSLGKRHNNYMICCTNLAVLYINMSQYLKAEPYFIEAKNITEEKWGKESFQYALSCNNLANLYVETGRYDKAEPLHLEARRIREKVLTREHPDYAGTCNNLANLYKAIAEYDKAESLYAESMQIRERIFGKESAEYAASCDNLGGLLRDIGQYEKAEALITESLQIKERVLGKENTGYASSLNNLGALYADIGQYEKTEPLYLEAKQIYEKVLGKENPEYARVCNNLGALYFKMDKIEKSEPFFLEAKEINKRTLGEGHPEYALDCNNLGNLYFRKGQYDLARLLFTEAKGLYEKVIGKEHSWYIKSCNNLGNLYWNLNENEKANDFYKEAFTNQFNSVAKIFLFSSEKEKQASLENMEPARNRFMSFTTHAYSSLRQSFSYDVSLRERNLIVSSSRQIRQAINMSKDTSVKNKYDNWIRLREQLSFWYAKNMDKRPGYLKDLEEQANTLEKDLTRLSTQFRKDQSDRQIGWKTIQQHLAPNEAAVEFIQFDYYNGKRWTDSAYYIALVLRKDKPEPVLFRLFEERQLDSALNSSAGQAIEEGINLLYYKNPSLYKLIWQPMEKHLSGISKIYFSPAGNLFKISFAALPINDRELLSDKYQLVQLNTTATVADNKPIFLTSTDKIQLYGAVQYDADSLVLKELAGKYAGSNEHSRTVLPDIDRGGSWNYLRGTEKEINGIEKLGQEKNFTVYSLSGINATEESVKNLNGAASPSVLHIATHGFFFASPGDSNKDGRQRNCEDCGKVFRQSDNPLFRSGLILAGANNAWSGRPVTGIEDGILTAYEVSNMYLPGTKLVVLSACETALGDIHGSEGVYGLQRAFKMAGVQNLVMSLWRIPDKETSEFMQEFYKNIFDKSSINDAFYKAQAFMKNKYRHEPYKWAAWLLTR